VAVVGDTGSGKTVLLDSVMGIVGFPHHRAGDILFEGIDLARLDDRSFDRVRGSMLTLIPSGGKTYLNPVIPIGSQLTRILTTHAKTDRRQAFKVAREWLARVGIPGPDRVMHAFPHELSGGMAQRVLIAAAMLCGSHLILADEPTAGLDVTVQKQVLDILARTVKESNTACLIVTRDLGIVAHYCDRLYVMDKGAIVESSDTRSFFIAPTSDSGKRMLELVRLERKDTVDVRLRPQVVQ
jgi:ABC-type dipeptide/oligopeptide/nickel transport system ATPase component